MWNKLFMLDFVLSSTKDIVDFASYYAALLMVTTPIVIVLIVGLYDILQTRHTIKRNYPIIGIARYFLELIGPELRQYLFHDERSDRPIPRYIRTWVYAHSKKQLATVAFGTKKDVDKPGTTLLAHSSVPINKTENEFPDDHRIIIGKNRKYPYESSRFNISAMSYGSLGKNAVLALSNGAAVGGFFLNTGEGGISPYHLEGGADLVAQIGTGKFGFRDKEGNFSQELFIEHAKNPQVKMFEIKLSQGAKPGKGGMLPAEKNNDEIASIRNIEPYVDVMSPPRHSEWSDEKGMLKWLANLQDIGGKPVGIKFCLGKKEYVDNLVVAMLETNIYPDFISIDGAEGATGAAPLGHTDYLGMPLKDGLMYLDDSLRKAGIRKKIVINASAKIITGADLAIIIALGADMACSARGYMLSIGCIHALKCNTNHCPAGIATHNPWLERGLVVEKKIPRVANYHHAVLHEMTSVMYSCGYEDPIGFKREDVLKVVDFHQVKSINELVPQPSLKACDKG